MTRPEGDDPPPKPSDAGVATTVLDRVKPTVVVRRRVYEPTANKTLVHVARDTSDDDENGPPSSVNVARALASLRGDELRRLEEIVRADDDSIPPPPPSSSSIAPAVLARAAQAAPPSAPAVAATPTGPTVRLGPSIALEDLAREMSVPVQELVTALVTRGFFSMTVTSVLSRETAKLAAAMFGWETVDDDSLPEATSGEKPKKKNAGAPGTPGGGGKAKAPKPTEAKKPPPPKRSVNRGR
ncbi:MAG: hypothetical protein JWP97_1180 [Labilithrix sp.]|nr:hypothetical protein [Labilithrix sp.]